MTATWIAVEPDEPDRHSGLLGSMRLALIGGLVAVIGLTFLPQIAPAGAIARHPSVKNKLLSIADMPAGWRIDNSSSSGGLGGTKCLTGLNKANKTPGQAEVQFEAGSGLPSVGEVVGSGQKLVRAFSELSTRLAECKTLKLKENGTTY
jgi:hypothetical protein